MRERASRAYVEALWSPKLRFSFLFETAANRTLAFFCGARLARQVKKFAEFGKPFPQFSYDFPCVIHVRSRFTGFDPFKTLLRCSDAADPHQFTKLRSTCISRLFTSQLSPDPISDSKRPGENPCADFHNRVSDYINAAHAYKSNRRRTSPGGRRSCQRAQDYFSIQVIPTNKNPSGNLIPLGLSRKINKKSFADSNAASFVRRAHEWTLRLYAPANCASSCKQASSH
jgi:hypothetical protein